MLTVLTVIRIRGSPAFSVTYGICHFMHHTHNDSHDSHDYQNLSRVPQHVESQQGDNDFFQRTPLSQKILSDTHHRPIYRGYGSLW